MSGAAVRALAGLAVLGAAHAAVNTALLRRPPANLPTVTRPVTVVVPVRDEEEQIGGCLAALLAQRGVDRLEVVVVDDGSIDRTAAVVRSVPDERVRLVPAPPPPPGWLGKPHACWVGATAVEPAPDGLLVFVDADVRLAPHALAAAATVLHGSDLDLVSPWPAPVAEGVAERLVQPLSPWLWATTLPVRLAERSPRPSLAAANGQFLLLTRVAYDHVGGHAAVRGEVLEDIALLRALKRAGGRGGPVDGSSIATCRMYDGWAALREGYRKSLWAAVGGSPVGSALAAAVLAAVYVVPPSAALRGSRAGLVGYAAGVAGRAVVAARTGGRVWPDSLAHPVSVALFAVLTADSVGGHRRGTLRWRGRAL